VVVLADLVGLPAEQDVDGLAGPELLPALLLQPPHGGEQLLRGERQVLLRRDPVKAASTRSSRTHAAPLPDDIAPIFEQLRAWRGAAAKEQGVPAYVIFHDATLREIATRRPTSLAELGRINGIGEAKLARHGQAVLDTLAEVSP
jgi:ATP-dependent DNA helicase RecQ